MDYNKNKLILNNTIFSFIQYSTLSYQVIISTYSPSFCYSSLYRCFQNEIWVFRILLVEFLHPPRENV